MNDPNKQADIRVFDTNYNKIGLMYRLMRYNDLLVDPMQRVTDYNKGFDNLVDKIFNSVKSINRNRLELPEYTNRLKLLGYTSISENSVLLSNMELRQYASGVVGYLNKLIRVQRARKPKPEDAMNQLVEAAKRMGADAIVVDADKPFQNEDGYGLVGLLYVKR